MLWPFEVLLLLLSLRYGADLGRSWLVLIELNSKMICHFLCFCDLTDNLIFWLLTSSLAGSRGVPWTVSCTWTPTLAYSCPDTSWTSRQSLWSGLYSRCSKKRRPAEYSEVTTLTPNLLYILQNFGQKFKKKRRYTKTLPKNENGPCVQKSKKSHLERAKIV